MKRAIQSRPGLQENFLLLSPSPPTKLLLYVAAGAGEWQVQAGLSLLRVISASRGAGHEIQPDFCGPYQPAVGTSNEDFGNWAIPLPGLTPKSWQL